MRNSSSPFCWPGLRRFGGIIALASLVLTAFLPVVALAGGKHRKFREWLSVLSGEDRAKYEAAKKQALLNPEVRAADERRRAADAEYDRLLHAEMLKVDPSLKAMIEKREELLQHNDL
jgi:hypothetical protein